MFMDVYAKCFGRADDDSFFLVALSVCATCNELRAFFPFCTPTFRINTVDICIEISCHIFVIYSSLSRFKL